MLRRLISAVLILAMVAGCAKQPGDDPGPMHKWFNPYGEPQEEEVPDSCPPGAQVPPPPDPPEPPRPKSVPANFNHATFHLAIDSMKWLSDEPIVSFEYCIPVSIYVYVTANGMPGEVVELRPHGVSRYTTPWNGLRTTPWRATIDVYWPPSDPRPVMNFELSAKYEVGEGLSRAPAPTDGTVGLSCVIRQNKNTLYRQNSLDIFGPPAGGKAIFITGPFVKCRPDAFAAIPA
jgi:hypothetical protein